MSIKSCFAVVIGLLAVAGCGGKKQPPSKERPAEPAPTPVAMPADAGTTARLHSPRPSYTPEQLREYKKKLQAGRKLARAKKWGEAVAAFEAALAAVPMDSRALSELGWAAFQAGDFDRARQANADAVRAATDPAVEAASRYNLGRVAEATGDADGAAREYRASLELRPNDTVAARLDGLGKPRPDVPAIEAQDLPCTSPAAPAELCRCLTEVETRTMAGTDGPVTCRREGGAVAGISIAILANAREEAFYLTGKSRAGWSVVAALGRTYNPGKFGINEELKVAEIEPRPVGDRRVLWVETDRKRVEYDAVVNEEERRQEQRVTLCLVPAEEERPITCPLQFPTIDDYQRVKSDLELEPEEEIPELATPGLPIESTVGLRVDLRPDGTANLILVQGEKTDRIAPYLGPHRLWPAESTGTAAPEGTP